MQTAKAIVLQDPPVRRMNGNDKALLETSKWVDKSELKLEDKVSVAHAKAAFVQGIVVFVGEVHFAEGVWVGIQLTGPSIGQGDCNGVYKGKRYFADVGRNNGVLAPLSKVNKRLGMKTGDPKVDKAQRLRRTRDSCLADMQFIDCLVEERAMAMIKLHEEQKKNRFNLFSKEEAHINRLKQIRLEEVLRARGALDASTKSAAVQAPNLKYSKPGSTLCQPDLDLVDGLEMTQQNYCLSDPLLPDNPITFVSQAFLNMTGYHMNEILGKNCRFLQGPETDPYHVNRIRLAIQEGSDCHVCLLNYRKNGKKFYNRLFITALRDTKGRIKNYLGVQCEVSQRDAEKINREEVSKAEENMKSARLSSTLEHGRKSSHRNNADDFDTSSNTGEFLTPRPQKPTKKLTRRSSNESTSHHDVEIPIVPYAGEMASDDEDTWAEMKGQWQSSSRKSSGPSRRASHASPKPAPPQKGKPPRRSSANSSRSSRSSDSDYTPTPRSPRELESYLRNSKSDEYGCRLSL